jgi:hypothetical protein
MPNYCENQLHIECNDDQWERIKKHMLSGKDHNGEWQEITFNVLIPMPDNIYRDNVGPEERAKYGKDNWYDWCRERWGTKWDAFDTRVEKECIQFTTAWCPPEPWYRELARRLLPFGVTAHADYYAEGGAPGSLGGYDLKDGELIETEADPEFAEIYEEMYDDEEEGEE